VTIEERRLRERDARRRLITATARALAEHEGWDAVTTRRLSTEIEYSQPVLYKHFASMEEIIEAVALEGFTELAETLGAARRAAGAAGDALLRIARAFSKFAVDNPALYDAMFSRTTRLHFGAGSPAPLHAAFSELRAAVAAVAREQDSEVSTEVLWAGLHGLATLSRSERLRPGHEDERIEFLVTHLGVRTERLALEDGRDTW
jgi:AcrR family transcriptional regulator